MNKTKFDKTITTLQRTGVLQSRKMIISERFKAMFLENIKRYSQDFRECIPKALMKTLLEWFDVVNEDQMSEYFTILSQLMNTDEMTRRIQDYGV